MEWLLIYLQVFLNPKTEIETRTRDSVPIASFVTCIKTKHQLLLIEYPEGHFVFREVECIENEDS